MSNIFDETVEGIENIQGRIEFLEGAVSAANKKIAEIKKNYLCCPHCKERFRKDGYSFSLVGNDIYAVCPRDHMIKLGNKKYYCNAFDEFDEKSGYAALERFDLIKGESGLECVVIR